MVSHAGFVVSHADFRGFTRARFVVSHAPLIKGLTWYLTFLTRLLRIAVGITPAPQGGMEASPGMRFASCLPAAKHSSKHRQRNIQRNDKHPVGQGENRRQNSRTASLHAFGINIQDQECANNARKRVSKARCMVSQWVGGLLVL